MISESTNPNETTGAEVICPNCRQPEMMPDAATAQEMFWCRECGLTATKENLQNMSLD